tara:strand:- start:6680 stop:6937 length:258 start_codon:yes stop_codon:yes gene_type:complete
MAVDAGVVSFAEMLWANAVDPKVVARAMMAVAVMALYVVAFVIFFILCVVQCVCNLWLTVIKILTVRGLGNINAVKQNRFAVNGK